MKTLSNIIFTIGYFTIIIGIEVGIWVNNNWPIAGKLVAAGIVLFIAGIISSMLCSDTEE